MGHLDPGLKAVFERSIAENDCALSAENVVGLDVLLRVGSSDRTVPPWHTRRYGRILREVGAADG